MVEQIDETFIATSCKVTNKCLHDRENQKKNIQQPSLVIELRIIYPDNKKRDHSKINPSKTRIQTPATTDNSISTQLSYVEKMNDDDKNDSNEKLKICWGYKTIKRASIPIPRSYAELQMSFARAFPGHNVSSESYLQHGRYCTSMLNQITFCMF